VSLRAPDPRDVRIREALALRAWALPALCGDTRPPPPASEGAWTTFLRAERCGLALLALGEARLGSAARPLRQRAGREAQRVLSGSAQLRRIARLAQGAGDGVVVLKGGVPLAERRPGADLVDVDVLAPPAAARALGAALDATGSTAAGRGSSHRLPERLEEDAVAVEIHTSVPGIDETAAFLSRAGESAVAGLRTPHPADHLWHLLLHGVAQHTGRRGNLRELVMVADALGRCQPADTAEAHARAAIRPDAAPLLAQLELGAALRERRPPARDPFHEVAAVAYTLVEYLAPFPLRESLKVIVWETTFLKLARRDGTAPVPSAGRQGAAARLLNLARRGPEWAMTPPALLLARRAAAIAANG
jgi:Uncharacterised nucleotidyltransferase